MSILSNAKEIADLIQQMGNIELYRKIVELQGDISDLSAKNLELKEENQQLKAALDLKAKMIWKKPFYFIENDDNPYCPNCWETKKFAIHLLTMGKGEHKSYQCTNCNFSGWP